ncbi:MAG TPA: type IV pilus biogenesis/stability protein PilW [Steroidobacteraceae bacterium]|nr:type IV pilus biogenesis/stability protein PilW [Steroidobacteraceae bacterium]
MSLRAACVVVAMVAASCAAAQSESGNSTEEAGRINARLAMEYLKRDQLQVAQEKIVKALAQNPRDVNVQLAAGLVYERLRDKREAEKHFRQALKADPDSPEAQNALGAFHCRNGEHRKGEEMFVKAAANPLYRTPFVAFTNAGVCARSSGDLELAERFLRQALTSQVDYPETFAQLAGVLHERGNDLQARAFVGRYLAVAPATPGMLLLGHAIEKALKDEAAAAAFSDRLKKEFPNSDQARSLDGTPGQNPG